MFAQTSKIINSCITTTTKVPESQTFSELITNSLYNPRLTNN